MGAGRAGLGAAHHPRISREPETYEGSTIIKSELHPDGRRKLSLKDATTGDLVDRVVAG